MWKGCQVIIKNIMFLLNKVPSSFKKTSYAVVIILRVRINETSFFERVAWILNNDTEVILESFKTNPSVKYKFPYPLQVVWICTLFSFNKIFCNKLIILTFLVRKIFHKELIPTFIGIIKRTGFHFIEQQVLVK